MKYVTFVAIIMMMALTGCASKSNISKQSQNYSGRAEIIAKGSLEEVKKLFIEEYQTVYDVDMDFSIEPTSANDVIEISMSWKGDEAFFPLGVYDLIATKEFNKRAGVAFADLVGRGVKHMAQQLTLAGIDYRLKATIFGQADGTPIRRLLYKNEYGPVKIDERIFLNGKPHPFSITEGQSITNAELAMLRAYSLRTILHQAAAEIDISDTYDIRTYKNRGLPFRSAKITLDIVNKAE